LVTLQDSPAKNRTLNNLGWKLFNALFPRTLESFARRFAIIRYKQLRGFYFEELSNLHLLFGIGDLKITGESNFNED